MAEVNVRDGEVSHSVEAGGTAARPTAHGFFKATWQSARDFPLEVPHESASERMVTSIFLSDQRAPMASEFWGRLRRFPFARGKMPMKLRLWMLLTIAVLVVVPVIYAGNQVMGELEFEGKSKVEKTSGVWVDGQYVGYLKELKGSKKVLLLPGEHTITVRQGGYRDFVQRVEIKPGEKRVIRVAMLKGPTGAMPVVTATVKISVNPSRAAVFVDGLFVGHVAEFEGLGRGLLVAPGPHTIKIALPGYQTFETQISPLARQKVEVRTNLMKSAGISDDPLISGDAGDRTPPPPPDVAPPPPPPQ